MAGSTPKSDSAQPQHEWDLQCASSLITGLPASSFCLGCVIGVLALSMLADSFLGRKKFLLLSCLTMSLSAFSTTFSTNIWMYSALRFFSGFGRASIGTCIIVLLTETVGKGCRGRVIFVAFFCFALGFLSLPAIAYITKDSSWRRMYLYTSLPVLIYSLFLYFFVYESPRWLFLQGRNEEAVAVLKKLSSATRCDYLEHIMNSDNTSLKQEKVKDDYFTSLKKLFEKGWACRRILIIMGLGCSLGLVYYGIPLGLGNLGFNLYLSVTFNAIIEVPSALILLFFVDRWNRRSSILTLFLASGISCSICAITGSKWEGVKIVFELLAFFCVCASCDFLAVFTVELFPTSVRNLATSLSRQSHVFGAVFSPMLISEGRKSKFFPYGVFGIVMIISGVLLCFLPETRGAKLCDTMDEQESKETDHVV